MKLKTLDLFSGAGGFALALKDFAKPVAYCEIDKIAIGVLENRMKDGFLPTAPIHGDITKLNASDLPHVDLITAGFPCQDVSTIGIGKGIEGGVRTKLIHSVYRLIKDLRPSYVFLENVPLITRDQNFPALLSILSRHGYNWAYDFFSATAEGALHKRDRWYLLAQRKSPDAVPVKTYCAQKLWSDLKIKVPVACDSRDFLCSSTRKFGKLYGNALVPAVACKAFTELHARLNNGPPQGQVTSAPDFSQALQKMEGKIWERQRRKALPLFPLKNIVVFPSRITRKTKNSRPRILKSFIVNHVPTPRTKISSGLLTTRTKNDIGPLVLSSNLTHKSLRGKSHARLSMPFVENLMGFPRNWCM